ncbi:hypothetical protein [Alicyclobacillus dauci]|uniref:Uncharacterized protein n=1 Tax=Alicyclobacillus dauci TaxID=1475485 RepID=A0ABY6Z935_9BACL|nr:hypothetical protein [Alicyclobacillus dauci]WAH38681.1 hypothetical protein NZD86_09455 [Alicyclobacillus dauci]
MHRYIEYEHMFGYDGNVENGAKGGALAMTQLEFFKTFGSAILETVKDDQLAMRLVSKAWITHRRALMRRAA